MKKFLLIVLILCTAIALKAQYSICFDSNQVRQIYKQQIRLVYCDSAKTILSNQINILDQRVLLMEGKSLVILEDVKVLEDYNTKLISENSNLQQENKRLNRKLTTFKIGFGVVSLVAVGSVAYFLLKK